MRRSTIRASLGGFALTLLVSAFAVAPAWAEGGSGSVRTLYATLLDVMHNGPALGPSGRYARIEPVIAQVFDLPLMTRLAVGPNWTTLDAAHQQRVTVAFGHYIAAVYAERFDSYAGEKMQVTGEQQSGGGPLVLSEIVKSTGEPVRINYLMRQGNAGWQIADVYLNGTISELATRRSEFAAIMQSRGVDGLIAALDSKAVALGGARTS